MDPTSVRRAPAFGVVVTTYGPAGDAHSVEHLVAAAEELGFADVWFGDHVATPTYASHLTPPDWLDALACCLVGLGRTNTLRFGTDVLVAPYRNPLVLASLAASADQLSNGRLTLGFGSGFLAGEFAALGVPYGDRGAITDEYLEVLRLLWDSRGPVEYKGTRINFEDVLVGPPPSQDPMPLWVGGNNIRAQRRAAIWGTGWHPLFPTPDQYVAGRRRIEELRGDLSNFVFSYSCPETQVLDSKTEPRSYTYGEAGSVPKDYSYVPPVPTAAAGRPRFVGTAEQVAEDISVFMVSGVQHFTLRFDVGRPDVTVSAMSNQMELFVKRVLPLLT